MGTSTTVFTALGALHLILVITQSSAIKEPIKFPLAHEITLPRAICLTVSKPPIDFSHFAPSLFTKQVLYKSFTARIKMQLFFCCHSNSQKGHKKCSYSNEQNNNKWTLLVSFESRYKANVTPIFMGYVEGKAVPWDLRKQINCFKQNFQSLSFLSLSGTELEMQGKLS